MTNFASGGMFTRTLVHTTASQQTKVYFT